MQKTEKRNNRIVPALFLLLMMAILIPAFSTHGKTKDAMTTSFRTVSTWKQGKETFVQMNVTLKNPQASAITDWVLSLKLDQKAVHHYKAGLHRR